MNQLIEATLQSLLDKIEASDGNWIKEWAGGGGMPRNHTTGRRYHGCNILLLWAERQKHGYPTQDWASYKQWKEAGYQVRQGERSTVIFISKQVEKKDEDGGESSFYRLMKCAFVFNAAQLEAPPQIPIVIRTEDERIEACDRTVYATCAKIREGMNPAYSPGLDAIEMPPLNRFDSAAAYYATVFHELTHWTAHKSRLARETSEYAAEELVAEFGAAFLCADHDIDGTSDNAAAYLKSWLGRIKGDRGVALVRAASQASKAHEYIINCNQPKKGDAIAAE